VDIEPHMWSDLLLQFGRRQIAVVEFKLGATLQLHQDPVAEEFWREPKGYGAQLNAEYPKHEKHYIILSSHAWYGRPMHVGWHFGYARWKDVACGEIWRTTRNPLLIDLRDCLAHFGVWDFEVMKAREYRLLYVPPAVPGMMWELLWAVFSSPDLHFSTSASSYTVDAEFTDRNTSHFGIQIQASASLPLTLATRPKARGGIAWFGYEQGNLNEGCLSVWLYCENEALCEQAASLWRSHKHTSDRVRLHRDETGHQTMVSLRGRPGQGETELDWFRRRLEYLCYWAENTAPKKTARRIRR
jgi:hypothetical protein